MPNLFVLNDNGTSEPVPNIKKKRTYIQEHYAHN